MSDPTRCPSTIEWRGQTLQCKKPQDHDGAAHYENTSSGNLIMWNRRQDEVGEPG